MCQDGGVVLAYLPPYPPDLNPIESFAQLKQWIKKNRVLAEQFGDDFSGFLRCGLEAIQSACKGHSAVQNLAMMTIWMVIWMKSWMSMNIIINILMSNLLFLEISTRMPFLRHSSKCAISDVVGNEILAFHAFCRCNGNRTEENWLNIALICNFCELSLRVTEIY